MWNYIVHTPARAFHRAFLKNFYMQSSDFHASKDVDPPQSISFNYCSLFQLTGEVYNLDKETGMRRAPSRQQSNP
jgi:hypothetical protein